MPLRTLELWSLCLRRMYALQFSFNYIFLLHIMKPSIVYSNLFVSGCYVVLFINDKNIEELNVPQFNFLTLWMVKHHD
jgi:hypothetical protein